ncbi:hypothetical protein H5410_048019 [Solanum commersonii]|uniref:Uncharacterized protein n=1 Tax=Solanum commersonii TaxID=4109 RepID=A0A9J5XGV6_SOLCO|nr:hypothetical protein H5410_048019 [Solanum commersonii]
MDNPIRLRFHICDTAPVGKAEKFNLSATSSNRYNQPLSKPFTQLLKPCSPKFMLLVQPLKNLSLKIHMFVKHVPHLFQKQRQNQKQLFQNRCKFKEEEIVS